LNDLPVHAGPAFVSLTAPLRFFLRRIALGASPPGFYLAHLRSFSIKTDPTLSAIVLRFLLRSVALEVPLPGLCFGELSNSSVKADPALHTVPLRFFQGSVTFRASLLGFRVRYHHDFSIEADPATRWWSLTTGARFLFGTVALTAPFLAIRRSSLNNDLSGGSRDAAPARFAILLRFLL
jgi:hypothetical protein